MPSRTCEGRPKEHEADAECGLSGVWAVGAAFASSLVERLEDRGAIRREVHSGWAFSNRADLDAVLHIEFPAHVADAWLARHPAATSISYGYVLFAVLT